MYERLLDMLERNLLQYLHRIPGPALLAHSADMLMPERLLLRRHNPG